MSHRLLIPRLDILEKPTYTFPAAVHIAVARGAENASCCQVAVYGEEALDIHVKVLANRFFPCIPPSDPVHEG